MIQGATVYERSFRGHTYKHVGVQQMTTDPSWFSFEDEVSVRDEFWDIQPGDWILDIGAGYGSYGLTALACGAEHVFAWTPQGHPGRESEATFLRESLYLNGWEDRMTIYESGLYNKTGWLNTVTQQFWDRYSLADGPVGGDVIHVQSPDDWFKGIFMASGLKCWMKLDVEGAEVEILGNSRTIVDVLRPKILVENHNFKRPTIEQEVRDLVTSWGYKEVATRPYHSVSHSLYTP